MEKKTRRGRGEGSIYRREDGRWEGVLDLGFDAQGRRKKRSVYGKTKKEVQTKLLALRMEREQGQLALAPERLTVGQFLDHWLKNEAKHRIRESTWNSYETKIRLHIAPIVGRIPLRKLEAVDLQALYAKKREEGLSARSVQYLHAILRNALNRAVRLSLVPRNVAKLTDPPRPTRKSLQVLTPDQAARLLEGTTDHPWHALFTLAITAGLRKGELLGLRWSDIDFNGQVLYVRQAATRPGRGGIKFGDPKNALSRRSVALSQLAIKALRDHRRHQEELRRTTPPKVDLGLVFCGDSGRVLDDGKVSREIHKYTTRLDLPRVRFHDLRHTAATLYLRQGVPLKVTSHILGHSTIVLTADTYSHVLPEMQRDAAKGMDLLLGKTSHVSTQDPDQLHELMRPHGEEK